MALDPLALWPAPSSPFQFHVACHRWRDVCALPYEANTGYAMPKAPPVAPRHSCVFLLPADTHLQVRHSCIIQVEMIQALRILPRLGLQEHLQLYGATLCFHVRVRHEHNATTNQRQLLGWQCHVPCRTPRSHKPPFPMVIENRVWSSLVH